MESHERRTVLGQLESSETRLLELVSGLTSAQWNFRETPERWSIAENIEHLALFENFILSTIVRVLAEPAESEKKALVAGKESLVLGLPGTRHVKFIAREAARPVGRWPDPAESVNEFRKGRARTVAFVAGTQAELRDHFFPHVVWEDLDCYQWLILLGQHTYRHCLQIEEIKANLAYPLGKQFCAVTIGITRR